MDDATIFGIVGMIVGGIGAAAGVMAIGYVHVAKGTAEQANTIAGDSKDLATKANELSRESNVTAADAKRLAEEANEYSSRAEAREVERHDVYWDGGWATRGVYRLYKRGDDAAHDIVATVTVDREEQTVTAPLLHEEHSHLDFHFPGAVAKRDRDAEADAEAERRAVAAEEKARQSGWPLAAVSRSPSPVRVEAITERVVWTTDRGTPKTHIDEARSFRR